jgi:hypothetical protein
MTGASMILLALLAAQSWAPHTIEYVGPGNFCGGGYRITLNERERALILPQGHGPQATRLVVSGGEVNVHTGARAEPGKVVQRFHDGLVTQVSDGPGIAYVVSNDTPYGLRLTSDAFRGFKSDSWFFRKAWFEKGSDQGVDCLAGRSF